MGAACNGSTPASTATWRSRSCPASTSFQTSRCARQGTTLSEFSVGCRQQLDAVMTRQPWSAVVVQGDTESAFLGALAAFYNRIPVAHVEAGLRTYNLERPFPEEGLRQMIGRLTRFHFAPTPRAHAALVGEGIAAQRHLHHRQHGRRCAAVELRAQGHAAGASKAAAICSSPCTGGRAGAIRSRRSAAPSPTWRRCIPNWTCSFPCT